MMKNESGRSMVEMLGVLAIIGVLSVGGIAGYTMAMNKYKANELASLASQCGVLAVGKATSTNTDVSAGTNCTTFGLTIPYSATMTVQATTTGTSAVAVQPQSTDTGIKTALENLKVTGSASNGNFSLTVS